MRHANDNYKHENWDELMYIVSLNPDQWMGADKWNRIRHPKYRDNFIWLVRFQHHYDKSGRELEAEFRRGQFREAPHD